MKLLSHVFLFLLLFVSCASLSVAQSGQANQQAKPQPTPPVDRPIQADDKQVKSIEEAIKPAIEKAKKSYPDAKKRYLAGLPNGYRFFLTTRLRDKEGRFEQSFIEVKEIKDGRVKGVIANEITLVSGYHEGDAYSFPETEMLDWTITAPDGTEEGNFVGKFLDEYQKQNP